MFFYIKIALSSKGSFRKKWLSLVYIYIQLYDTKTWVTLVQQRSPILSLFTPTTTDVVSHFDLRVWQHFGALHHVTRRMGTSVNVL